MSRDDFTKKKVKTLRSLKKRLRAKKRQLQRLLKRRR